MNTTKNTTKRPSAPETRSLPSPAAAQPSKATPLGKPAKAGQEQAVPVDWQALAIIRNRMEEYRLELERMKQERDSYKAHAEALAAALRQAGRDLIDKVQAALAAWDKEAGQW